MALDANTQYVVIETHHTATGTLREGDVRLGSKLAATSEPYVIALGATAAEISAARVTAGLKPGPGGA